jgi:hypothetical protein
VINESELAMLTETKRSADTGTAVTAAAATGIAETAARAHLKTGFEFFERGVESLIFQLILLK